MRNCRVSNGVSAFSMLFARCVTLAALITIPVVALGQATIRVPQDQATIQAGINAAGDGDTVLVAPGTYMENIDFMGKSITVTSSGGAATTIIDGGGVGPTVTFQSQESRTAVLSGMTIQNAGGYGVNITAAGIAGILVSDSSPTILNNTITQNQCWDVEILMGAPLIQGNEISSTISPSGSCGGGSGAGIYVGGNLAGDLSTSDGTSAVISGNTIEGIVIPAPVGLPPGTSNLNDSNGGAAIAIFAGSPIIEGNILRNNSAAIGNGGAINVAGGAGATIAQNLIYRNSAGCGGGAIAFSDIDAGLGTYLLIVNNTIVDNTGGSSTAYATCGNAAQIYGSDYGLSTQNVLIVNNIVSSTTSDTPAVGCFSGLTSPDEHLQSIFDHNLLYNGGGNVFGPTCVDVSAKYGDSPAAPQFVNAAGGDYHLVSSSPGIDAGNNSGLELFSELNGTTLSKDFDGNPREYDSKGIGYPVVDIGAFEYAGSADGNPTTAVLTASTYELSAGDQVLLTAKFYSALGVPAGLATFYLDGDAIGKSQITTGIDGTAGAATLIATISNPGVHSLYVTYPGAGSFTPAISVITIILARGPPATTGYATTLHIYSAMNPQPYGQDVTFTIQTSSADPNPAFVPSPITLSYDREVVFATLLPDKNGKATYSIKNLPLGFDYIQADYAGDPTHQAATANLTEFISDGIGTRMELACTPLTIMIGQTSLLTATVSSMTGGTPTGPVVFTDDAMLLGEAPLENGAATWTYLGRSRGLHGISSNYLSTGAYDSAGPSQCGVTVLGLNSKAVLTVAPVAAPYQTTRVMTATVSAANPPGFGTPTGPVDFLNGTDLLGTVNLAGGVATLNTNTLSAGTGAITCMYHGDLSYEPSNCNIVPVTTSLAQPILTVTASADHIPALTPVTFTVKLSVGGQPPLTSQVVVLTVGSQTYTLRLDPDGTAGSVVTDLLPGVYPVTASFAGTSNLLGSSASLTETVMASPSMTVLAASPNPGYVGQTVTLSAMVTAADTLVPEGATVTFYDGTAAIGTGTLDQTRTATFATSSLTAGLHALTASYPGGGSFLGSTSPVFNEMILASSFTIALSPTSITVPTDQTATVAIQLTSIGGFTGPLTLSYGPLPMNASASITPASVTLTPGGAGASTLTLSTASRTLAGARRSTPQGIKRWPVILAAGLFLLIPGRRRTGHGRRGPRLLIWLACSVVLLQTVTGCGNSFYNLPGVAPGTYQIAVTATDTHQNQQTAILTLVVPPH